MTTPNQINSAKSVKAYILAGGGKFTLVSRHTGKRFTYRLHTPKNTDEYNPPILVSVLTGPSNTHHFSYLGCIWTGKFRHGKKSRISEKAPSSRAIAWFLRKISDGALAHAEFWHEGKCGRCGKALTVPESIESGLGPSCRLKVERANPRQLQLVWDRDRRSA